MLSFVISILFHKNNCVFPYSAAHVSHLEDVAEDEINRLLGIVVDVENLFLCVHKEEDADTKQVYFYLFKVSQFISSCEK